MNRMQEQVLDFHRVLGHTIGEHPHIGDAELRSSLILEEAKETVEALLGREVTITISDEQTSEPDIIGTIDGLCDLLYVVFGAAVTMGFDVEPFFEEVHRSNMLKAGGPVRADGKRLKPEGWEPPRIREILEKHWKLNV